jgi:hypothetical protein
MKTEEPISEAPPTRSTNWWGLCSTVGLFIWVLFWLKREPGTAMQSVLCWGTLAAIHVSAIKAVRLVLPRPNWFLLDSRSHRAVGWHNLLKTQADENRP